MPDSKIACCKKTEWIDSRTFITLIDKEKIFEVEVMTRKEANTIIQEVTDLTL
jgi:DNA-directed RNA polymerase alpha subunit